MHVIAYLSRHELSLTESNDQTKAKRRHDRDSQLSLLVPLSQLQAAAAGADGAAWGAAPAADGLPDMFVAAMRYPQYDPNCN